MDKKKYNSCKTFSFDKIFSVRMLLILKKVVIISQYVKLAAQ